MLNVRRAAFERAIGTRCLIARCIGAGNRLLDT
jgi:hypothetical protein